MLDDAGQGWSKDREERDIRQYLDIVRTPAICHGTSHRHTAPNQNDPSLFELSKSQPLPVPTLPPHDSIRRVSNQSEEYQTNYHDKLLFAPLSTTNLQSNS